jgi:hypothetical protein
MERRHTTMKALKAISRHGMIRRLRAMRKLRILTTLLFFAAVACLVVGVSSYVASARFGAPAPAVAKPAVPAPAVGKPTSPAPAVGKPAVPAPAVAKPTSPAPAVGTVPSPASDVSAAQSNLTLVLSCGGVNFSGSAAITTTVAYTLSRGGSGAQAVVPGPFNFDVPWNPTIQGLQGPFVESATGTLDLSGEPAPNLTVSVTQTLTCSGNG